MNLRYKAWTVVFAGMGVNLALGVLYSWGAFQTVLVSDPFNWSAVESLIPYMIAIFVFAIGMVPSGGLQDRIGPRIVITLAGVTVLLGLTLSGLFLSPLGLAISFGVIFGIGMSLGYSAPTPAAVKWFDSHRRGLVSGIVVGGFGLAGVYIAPLVKFLLERYELSVTFVILGFGYGLLIIILAQFINNPPAEYIPPNSEEGASNVTESDLEEDCEYTWKEMVKTPQFYSLWFMFCVGTLAGLLIIGQLRSIGLEQANLTSSLAFWLIAQYALFNWVGRVGCGLIYDWIGRKRTLIAMFILQTAVFTLFPTFTSLITLFTGTALVAITFGGMLTIFPTITADYFGVKHMGMNYGLVFTAWGIGGVFGPLLGGVVRDLTGTYTIAYIVAAILSVFGIILAVTIKSPHKLRQEG